MSKRCEAMVMCEHGGESERCERPAYKDDRLCIKHRRARRRINAPIKPIIITINKKYPNNRDKHGKYKKIIVGRYFRDYESAQTWMDLNWSLLVKIPYFKSACIERMP